MPGDIISPSNLGRMALAFCPHLNLLWTLIGFVPHKKFLSLSLSSDYPLNTTINGDGTCRTQMPVAFPSSMPLVETLGPTCL